MKDVDQFIIFYINYIYFMLWRHGEEFFSEQWEFLKISQNWVLANWVSWETCNMYITARKMYIIKF